MDFSALLPLLLASNKNGRISLSDLVSSSAVSPDLIKSSGASPEVAAMLSSALSRRKPESVGFKPILPFVSDDILGKLTRWFS